MTKLRSPFPMEGFSTRGPPPSARIWNVPRIAHPADWGRSLSRPTGDPCLVTTYLNIRGCPATGTVRYSSPTDAIRLLRLTQTYPGRGHGARINQSSFVAFPSPVPGIASLPCPMRPGTLAEFTKALIVHNEVIFYLVLIL